MAINEVSGFLKYKDQNGDLNLLLPITNKDNIDGMDEIEAELSTTIKYTSQSLTDEQKAQVRANIGVNDVGSDVFVVTLDGSTNTSSHSPSEIQAAKNSGKTVIGNLYGVALSFLGLEVISGVTCAKFSGFGEVLIGGFSYIAVIVHEDKSIILNANVESMNVPFDGADAGKILTATADGAVWTEASSTGSNVLIVTLDTNTNTSSHSPSEIRAAKEAGKLVFGILDDVTLKLLSTPTDTGAIFTGFGEGDTNYLDWWRVSVDADKNFTAVYDESAAVTIPDASSAGEILTTDGNKTLWTPRYDVTEIELINGTYTTAINNDLGAYIAGEAYNYVLGSIPTLINVAVDGVEYKHLPVTEVPNLGACFGNLSMMNPLGFSYEDTGEPFIVNMYVDGAMFTTDLTQSKTNEFKISRVESTVFTVIIDNDNMTASHSPGEIEAARCAGLNICAKFTNESAPVIVTPMLANYNFARFGASVLVNGVAYFITFTINEDKRVTREEKEFPSTFIGTAGTAEGAEVFNYPDNVASGAYSHAEGAHTNATGPCSHAEGINTTASGVQSHAEGNGSQAIGRVSHAEGQSTHAIGEHSHAEGLNSEAIGSKSHAEGNNTVAAGISSHAEGVGQVNKSLHITGAAGATTYSVNAGTNFDTSVLAVNNIVIFGSNASLIVSVASDYSTITVDKTLSDTELNNQNVRLVSYAFAYGEGSHVEGGYNKAIGANSHAEGGTTVAAGISSHAEGVGTTANARASHAEGQNTEANGLMSHAEGFSTKANGLISHAEGQGTIANSLSQHVQGAFNLEDTEGDAENRGKYAHIVGNGTAADSRSNAHTVDWDGLGWFAGGLKIGGTSQDDENAKEVATKEYVDSVASSGGSGGTMELPYFDLGALGLPATNKNTYTNMTGADVADIITALENGPVLFGIPVILDGHTMTAIVMGSPYYLPGDDSCFASGTVTLGETYHMVLTFSASDGFIQLSIDQIVRMAPGQTAEVGQFLRVASVNGEKTLYVEPADMPAIPTPTESDYGKVLTFTADGLAWVTPTGGSSTPSSEGVEF